MPDTLLSHLADDAEIPLSAKRAIASKLAADSLIDFRFLAEVDADLHYDAERHAREENDGFKKMSRYKSDEIESSERSTHFENAP